jgi:hypothetical protein
MATLTAAALERLAPVWVAYREAAAVSAPAAANLLTAHRNRLHTFTNLIGALPRARLRHSPEDSAETVWAVASPDVYLLLGSVLGWDNDRYADWLRQTLVDLLLIPEPEDPGQQT